MSFADPKLNDLRESILSATPSQPFGAAAVCPGEPDTPFFGWPQTVRGGARCFHRGTDFVLKGGPGAAVRAPISGRVIFAGRTRLNQAPYYQGNIGEAVFIQSPNGTVAQLGHMADFYNWNTRDGRDPGYGSQTQVGQIVEAGDIIGHQGYSGAVWPAGPGGTHVHMELHNPKWASSGNPYGLGNLNTKRDVRDLWYTIYHPVGLGTGNNPGQEWNRAPNGTTDVLPELSMPPWGTDHNLGPSEPGGAQTPPGSGTGGSTGGGSSGSSSGGCPDGLYTPTTPCPAGTAAFCYQNGDSTFKGCVDTAKGQVVRWDEGPWDWPGQAVGGMLGGMLGGAGEWILVGAVALAGLALLVLGVRSLSEDKTVRVVTQPVADAVDSARGTAAQVAKVAALA